MVLNDVLTRQNVFTKIVLKDGDKELSKELKVKIMRITKKQYEEFRNAITQEIQLHNMYAKRAREARTVYVFDVNNVKVIKYRHAICQMADLMNKLDDDRTYTVDYVDNGFYADIEVKVRRC